MSFFPINSAPITQYTNYIGGNPRALNDTTGWATYKDAAQATPVDGTGGSPTLTFTRTTSSPLEGPGSFLITTTAANLQGEGASYDFTINSADQAQVISISFNYQISSGTYATGDFAVYIYDVTNALIIQPSGYQIQAIGNTSLSAKQIATFQTSSNSTSYRLIIHRAVSTASAVTMKVDSIITGPQTVQYGAPVTDWQSYTPTFGMTNQTTTGKWRRVGDQMEVQFYVDFSSSSSGTPSISLPSGYTIDTAKLTDTSTRNIGVAAMNEAGQFELVVRYGSTTTGTLIALGASGTYVNEPGLVSGTVPVTIAATSYITGQMSVPITGWSSTVQMSNDTDTRVCTAKVTTSSSTGAANTVNFSVTSFDTHGAVSTPSSQTRFTAPIPGYYRFSAQLVANAVVYSINDQFRGYIELNDNGTEFALGRYTAQTTTSAKPAWTGSTVVYMNAGDYAELKYSSSASVTLDGSALNYLAIERLTGPSAIASSESVNANYTKNATQSMANSAFTLIDFATKVDDSHGSVTTGASWKFTAPTQGMYEISGMVVLAAGGAWGVGDRAIVALYKNNVEFSRPFYYDNVVAHTQAVSCQITSKQIRLLAGDFIDYRLFQDSGGAINVTSDVLLNWVSIKRTGN